MSVGHLDHVLLTVYSSMEHETWNLVWRSTSTKKKWSMVHSPSHQGKGEQC